MKHFSNSEILQIIEAVSHEKSIPKNSVFSIIEDALKAAAKRQYGFDPSIQISINRSTGEIKLYREMIVVEDEDYDVDDAHYDTHYNNSTIDHGKEGCAMMRISLTEAQKIAPNAVVGDILHEDLPPLNITRLAAKVTKNVMNTRMKEIEREKQYSEFKNKVGEIVQGVVEKIEFGNVIVKVGDAEAILKRCELLRSDRYRKGDRVKAYLSGLSNKPNEPQLILSRTANEFVMKLFEHEVPEVYDHIVEIVSIVRDPGSRTKIAVHATDLGVDPVGACVGIRGSRVQAVINELRGEKIDVIQWNQDKAKLVLNALAPLDVLKLVIDEKNNRVEVVVEDGQESAAIGRRGQNVRLIAELIGMNVIIMAKGNEATRRKKETDLITKIFVERLDLDEMLARLLVTEGYTSISELANATIDMLIKIPGLDVGVAEELINRAVETQKNISDALAQNLGLTEDLAQTIADKGFDDVEKLSYACVEDLVDDNCGVDKDTAMELIDRAIQHRKHTTTIAEVARTTHAVVHDSVSEHGETNMEHNAKFLKLMELFPEIMRILDENDIRSVQKIADFDNLELKEILEESGYSCDLNIINSAIMAARAMV